jgi:hypothetical protein
VVKWSKIGAKVVMWSISGQIFAVKWPLLKKEGGKVGLLDEIRAMENPGKRGGEFVYAQVIYACFSEIQKLKAEGFTLTTICKFLERKGTLPAGSDPRSFCRAFRRENIRRKQVASKEGNIRHTAKEIVKTKENALKHEISGTSAKQEPEIPFVPAKPKMNPGVQMNPDNTFKIAPIDPDDLPDI